MANAAVLCAVDGCNGRLKGHGYCHKHMRRWQRHGDPLGGGPARSEKGALLRWINEVALCCDQGDCLEWPFGSSARAGSPGYGFVTFNGTLRGAHTVVAELRYGAKPDGLVVSHNCGNPRCCNPGHLRYATQSENLSDRLMHGTHRSGSMHANAKLSADDVNQIRLLFEHVPLTQIAEIFGVSRAAVTFIRDGKTYKE